MILIDEALRIVRFNKLSMPPYPHSPERPEKSLVTYEIEELTFKNSVWHTVSIHLSEGDFQRLVRAFEDMARPQAIKAQGQA